MASGVGGSAFGSGANTTPWRQAQDQQMDGIYDVAREKPPAHPFFKHAVAEALDFADAATSKLQLHLEHIVQTYPDIPGLAELLLSSRVQLPASNRRLAVVGDSGQGKSSLINSLLHIPDIAHTSDMGSACTSVVIEYHLAHFDQTSPFHITVEFYSGAALEDIVKQMAWSCRQYWIQRAQEADQGSGQDTAELDDSQKESQVAEEALKSAFGHHEGFSLEFLRDLSDGAQDRVINRLIQWAHAIDWPGGETMTTPEGSTIWHCSVEDVEECAEKTGAFMKDKLWPFTKVIKVYLSSPILETGLILADLPGLHDTNLARVRASKLYLLDCEEVLIVGRIGRITTDQSIKRYIMDEADRLKALRDQDKPGTNELTITVVCTAADDINVKAATAEFVGDDKPISVAEMKRLKAELNAAKASRNYQRKDAAEKRLQFTLVNARNQLIISKMKKTYEPETGACLNVFCVGNRAYEEICETEDTTLVEATGIPALRQYCHTITADDRLEEARYWMQTTVPSLYQSTEAWAHRMLSNVNLGEEKRRIIATRLCDIHQGIPEQLEYHMRTILEEIWKPFVETWTAHQDEWNQAAIRESVLWDQWHWSSFNAWCRCSGHHTTRARGHVNWNLLMASQMKKDMSKPWTEVLGKFKRFHTGVVNKLVDELEDFVQEELEGVPTAEKKLLVGTIKSTTKIWRHRVTKEIGKFTQQVTKMKAQSVNIDELAYITRQMIPTYREAFFDRGVGIAARQRACIAGKLASGTLFPDMAAEFSKNIETGTNKAKDSVCSAADEVMEKLVRQFDVVLTPKKSTLEMESLVHELKMTLCELSDGLGSLEKF